LTCIKSNLAKKAKYRLLDLGQMSFSFVVFGDLRMKKLLIATAALAMVAGTAQAQSSVTVYGIIDTGYNNVETTTSAGVKTDTTQVRTNGEASTSRFGLRGSEDLGGGTRANFQIETNIGNTNANNTAGSTNLGDRAFWVGLENAKMGQLRLGLQDSTVRSNWLTHDQLAAANVVGNLAHNQAGAANGSGASNAAAGSHSALNTAVNYLSPRMNGVQLTLGVTQSEVEASNATKTKTGSGSQAGLNYTAGKFSAGVAYVESTTSVNASDATGHFLSGTSTTSVSRTSLGVAAVAAANTKNKETSAAASYDLGVAKVAYIYNKRDSKNASDASDWASNIDRTSHSLSASVPVGAKTVLRAGYGFGELRQGAASNYNADIKGMQAAVNYNLSKRTTAYVIYGDESREIDASTKAKAKEYSVGVRHSF
jgi:predicted porin